MANENESCGKILVLDDEKTNIDIIKNAIEGDYNLYYALKPADALMILKRINVDLLLLDILMPEMDGYEFCRNIKNDEALKNIPVIFITGKNDIASVIKGFEAGAVDYITKPFEVPELMARVRTQMELQGTKRQLENTNKALIRLNATKDRLFSIIGHDLRGSVGGIDSLLQFLLDTNDMGADEMRRYIKEMKSYASFAGDLLENLLNWALTQENRLEFNRRSLSLSAIVRQCSQTLGLAAHAKNITVKDSVDEGITIYADGDMIMTVIRNLLSNAIKFTHPGGSVSISASEIEDCVKISVADTGVGIAAEKLKTIFNTGKDNSTGGTAGEKGTGLGLFLCRELIEKHHGEISAESEEGKGSVFIFTLPKQKK
ncbi:MAG: response regulator receiver sensor signal transduction histidine kinase [uncultured bacterium]|nr:MAG: response regulator receiver sensor signal transduction histidine kinase [uncultured bacterium]HBC74888.1 hybrid sensor histidine kinase/response regulator [Candidatus Wallbacteria bacterium]